MNVTNALINVTDWAGLLTYSNNETGQLFGVILVLITWFGMVIVLRNSKISIGASSLVALLVSLLLQSLGEVSGTVTVMAMIGVIIGMAYAVMTKN